MDFYTEVSVKSLHALVSYAMAEHSENISADLALLLRKNHLRQIPFHNPPLIFPINQLLNAPKKALLILSPQNPMSRIRIQQIQILLRRISLLPLIPPNLYFPKPLRILKLSNIFWNLACC
jgi:hypothetical protein